MEREWIIVHLPDLVDLPGVFPFQSTPVESVLFVPVAKSGGGPDSECLCSVNLNRECPCWLDCSDRHRQNITLELRTPGTRHDKLES